MTEFERAMEQLCERVARDLPDLDLMTTEDIATVLIVYDEIIRHHFVLWMTATWTRCVTDGAEHACWDNLQCEVGHRHPRMLRRFIAPVVQNEAARKRAGAALAFGAYANCCYLEERVRDRVEGVMGEGPWQGNALNGLLVMACLENASRAFIPWMALAGEKVGVTDFEYTTEHGEADIQHAKQFTKAVMAEVESLRAYRWLGNCNSLISEVEKLLGGIFHAYENRFYLE